MAKLKTGIYAIRNTVTGERYVGQAVDILSRWRNHRADLERGEAHSPNLQSAWKQYGPEAFVFEILEECPRESLEEREDTHMRDGCSYNHVQPIPELTIDASDPEIGSLLQKLSDALGQLTPEELANYEAELDAEERAEEAAEAECDRRVESALEFCQALIARSARESISEPDMAELLRYVERGDGHVVAAVADALSKGRQFASAERLLLSMCEAEERESAAQGDGVSPLPYERLAVLYQKTKHFDEEVKILERFARLRHAPGTMPARLLERLRKAQQRGC